MARAQRLGQTKQVTAVRYIMENTIESVLLLHSLPSSHTLSLMQQQSNVLNKQMKKAALAGDGFGREKFQESLVSWELRSDSVLTPLINHYSNTLVLALGQSILLGR